MSHRRENLLCSSLILWHLFLMGSTQLSAQMAWIDKQVTVQPIQVRDSEGLNGANPSRDLFEQVTDKIWSQAGIDVRFLEWTTFDDTRFLNIGDVGQPSFNALIIPQPQSLRGGNDDPFVLNMWFVHSIEGAFGRAANGNDGIVISDEILTPGSVRIDTIAHEIGHTLGLDHSTYGAGSPDNLMTAEGRTVPLSSEEIHPHGENLDRLIRDDSNPSASQYHVVRSSPFAVDLDTDKQYFYVHSIPEPAIVSYAWACLLALLGLIQRHSLKTKTD